MADYSIFDGTGLFWADSEFTGNLIAELEELRDDYKWQAAPKPVKYLLSEMPEHEHAPAPDFIEDDYFYITNINEQQRKAARAVAEHALTIVTGPPGTGKSQLVLNLIAQAYLNGKTVLFASHNNKAVDVVMDRLQGETGFQGAIRTGSRPNRKRAVEQMESAIAQIHQPAIKDFEDRYHEGKFRLKQASDQLDLIRDLKGKIQSYLVEKQDILEKLTGPQKEAFASIQLPFIENDKLQLNHILSHLAEDFRALIAERQQLAAVLREAFTDNAKKHAAVQVIRAYEQQWGPFAGGMIHTNQFASLSELVHFCSTFEQLLASITAKKCVKPLLRACREVEQEIDQKIESMTEEQSSAALLLENRSLEEINGVQAHVKALQGELQRIQENNFSFFKKIAIALRLIHPKRDLSRAITAQLTSLEMSPVENLELDELRRAIDALSEVASTALLFHEMRRRQEDLRQAEARFDEVSRGLPEDHLSELDRLDLSEFDDSSLIGLLAEVEQQGRQAAERFSSCLQRCQALFVKNGELIQTIDAFRQWAGQNAWDAYGLNEVKTENQALAWVQLWQRVIVLWEANAVIQHSEAQLAKLPSEEEALAVYQNASQALFTLAGELMRATWYSRARQVSNATFEGTQKYISAVRQLSELDYGKNPDLYRNLKDAERQNFAAVLKMFPVWAITNLTARTNFPLDAGLFDLVIIDEASQCDIPSAIPLLFRAKEVAIIGDPNQLRHVATLPADLDEQIGQKYWVGLDAFSYISHSLYDIGERGVGFHPGPILLNEHYRSDPRIITFSNEEFYGGQLIIKTDLTRRGYQKDYLNKHCGAYWLKTKGDFQRPENGSAYNTGELEQIKIIVPQLLAALDRNGYPNSTIGIVTPFRAQETRIREWVNRTYPNNSRVKSGTAHQFQGDECDVILFSPVLAAGISEGTLNWLEETYNLLNVAITRARASLIIVGDFDFCYHYLPAKSRYHRLAKYVNDRLGGVFETLTELPVLGGERFEILGTLLDPSNPEANRTNLIRFIRSCQDYICWIDPYFNQGIIDLFDELYEDEEIPKIKQIRLMTAERQVKNFHGKPPELRPEAVVRLQEYLKSRGVDLAMRVLPGEQLPHDRFFYHPAGAINMPPFAGAFGKHRHLSEYTPSRTTVENFEKYWNRGIPIEEY